MEEYLQFGMLGISILILVVIIYKIWQSFQKNRTMAALAELGFTAEPIIANNELNELAIENEKDQPVWQAEGLSSEEVRPNPPENLMADLLVISVVAKPGCCFAGYDLFHAISATGMQFGEMDIFHYYEMTKNGKIKLFSLASATKPGEFNLDRIGEFTCIGLTLFARLSEVPDAQEAYELMLDTAKQLADDLDGDLRAGQRTPWSLEVEEEYQQRVLNFT